MVGLHICTVSHILHVGFRQLQLAEEADGDLHKRQSHGMKLYTTVILILYPSTIILPLPDLLNIVYMACIIGTNITYIFLKENKND
jgi:hypothetical protein